MNRPSLIATLFFLCAHTPSWGALSEDIYSEEQTGHPFPSYRQTKPMGENILPPEPEVPAAIPVSDDLSIPLILGTTAMGLECLRKRRQRQDQAQKKNMYTLIRPYSALTDKEEVSNPTKTPPYPAQNEAG